METAIPQARPDDYLIQGERVRLPCIVRDACSATATWLVSAKAAQALLPGPELEIAEVMPGRGLLSIACIDYRDNDLGDYNEVSIAFFVRRRGEPKGVPYLGAAMDMMRESFRRTSFTCQSISRSPARRVARFGAFQRRSTKSTSTRVVTGLGASGTRTDRTSSRSACPSGVSATSPNKRSAHTATSMASCTRRRSYRLRRTSESVWAACSSRSALTRSRTSFARSACRNPPSWRCGWARCAAASKRPAQRRASKNAVSRRAVASSRWIRTARC